MTTRRTFLKLAAAVAGAAAGVIRYAEPLEDVAESYRDWIEDRGDFYIVRVPRLQVFANEELLKPTIFLMGEKSLVRGVSVAGIVNLQAPRGGMFCDNQVDGSMVTVGRNRPTLEIVKSEELTIAYCTLISHPAASGCAAWDLDQPSSYVLPMGNRQV